MGAAVIDPDLRIGRFTIDDIYRALGFRQWSLKNIFWETQLSEPLLAEILGLLEHVGIVELSGHPPVYYRDIVSLSRSENLVRPITQSRAASLIEQVLIRAEALNGDPAREYFYRRIYLFGSVLAGAEAPKDVDLAVEIDDVCGDPVPEPSNYPFGPRSEFASVAVRLTGKKRADVNFHHIREVQGIGAAHKLIWDAKRGQVHDSAVVKLVATRETMQGDRSAKLQPVFDTLVKRISGTTDWPEPPRIELMVSRPFTRSQWLNAGRDELVLGLAHHQCLPDGRLRLAVQRINEMTKARRTKRENSTAEKLTERFIEASVRFCPWSLRENGRLLRSAVV